jgi:hypothetical protein
VREGHIHLLKALPGPRWWAKMAYRGGFHREVSLPILEGSDPVATATDE